MNEPVIAPTDPLLTPVVTIDEHYDHIDVSVRWEGAKVDKVGFAGWRLKPTDQKLAERLATAICAGAVCGNPRIKTDIYGETYVDFDIGVLARAMNADLRRLG